MLEGRVHNEWNGNIVLSYERAPLGSEWLVPGTRYRMYCVWQCLWVFLYLIYCSDLFKELELNESTTHSQLTPNVNWRCTFHLLYPGLCQRYSKRCTVHGARCTSNVRHNNVLVSTIFLKIILDVSVSTLPYEPDKRIDTIPTQIFQSWSPKRNPRTKGQYNHQQRAWPVPAFE